MKVYQFLKKMLWGSSDIEKVEMRSESDFVIVLPESDLQNPGSKDCIYYDEMQSTVRSFRIRNRVLTIYCY